MRILYLSTSNVPSRQANSIQVMKMCEAFAQNGHAVTLIARQYERSQTDDPFDYYGVEKNFELVLIRRRNVKGLGIRMLPRLYALLRRHDRRETLIYARDIYGASLALRMGFRVVYEAHAVRDSRVLHCLEAMLLKSPRLIRLVVISGALKALYASIFTFDRDLVVCHDAATVANGSTSETLSWPSCRNTLQIGYTGQLYPGKGAEIVIECAKYLAEYDFHIIGGSEDDIALWKVHATPNVYFHGFVQPGIVHEARNKCDILLMPPQKTVLLSDGRTDIANCMSPLKLFEYMASHRPIIASNLPVLREVLDDSMAILVPPDDVNAWITAIKRCEDRAVREALAERAYQAVVERYTWKKRAERALEGIQI